MNRHLPWLALLLLVIVGAWLLRTGLLGAQPAGAPSEPALAAPLPGAPHAAGPLLMDETLPADTLPLPQRLAELERLAEVGHPQASCQLVVERLRCSFLRQWKPGKGELSRELRFESEGHLELANEIAEASVQRIEQKKACRSAPPIESVDSLALLGQAAAAGHAPSGLLYFQLGHELRNERGIFRHPHFDAWRRDAARRLHAAFRAGHPGAASALGNAYRDDGGFANALVPDDPRLAYLHLKLAQHLSGGRRRLRQNLDMDLGEEERARLDIEAMRMHREQFGGHTYESPELSLRSAFRQPELGAADFCSELPPL